jgi:hypothetical protein
MDRLDRIDFCAALTGQLFLSHYAAVKALADGPGYMSAPVGKTASDARVAIIKQAEQQES